MSDVLGVIRDSIRGISGLGGVLRFNALYSGGFETADGRPDMPAIGEAIGRAFPPEQARIIMASVTQKLGYPAPETTLPDTQPVSEGSAADPAAGAPGNGKQNGTIVFAQYFNVDPGQVQDIVSQARRVRLAMGKPVVATPPDTPADNEVAREKAAAEVAPATVAEKAAVNPAPPEPVKVYVAAATRSPRPVERQVSEIDREIAQFARGQTAYTSIDIMDFIRQMKDKGYSFDECIVLEKIYVKIEERKKEARSTIEREIAGIFGGVQAPMQPDINGLIGHLRESGLIFEEEDVRRMARVAALRRAEESI